MSEVKPSYSRITAIELSQKLKSGDKFNLIDVREEHEKKIADIGGKLIPLLQIESRHSEITKDLPTVVYCRSGGRSAKACEQLISFGFKDVSNLEGGILGWSDEVDSSIVKY